VAGLLLEIAGAFQVTGGDVKPAAVSVDVKDDSMGAQFERAQASVIQEFADWLKSEDNPDVIAEAAGRVLLSFSEDVLHALHSCAAGHADRTAVWIRREFAEAMIRFGRALQAQMPAELRHDIAQVLQVRVLEAERRFGQALRSSPPSPSPS
jgi:hypothetical protein